MRRPSREAGPERVRRAYASYGRSQRRRRAWAADNRGNIAARAELLSACWELVGAQLADGAEVLDAGCGTGFWLRSFVERGVSPGRLHGIELLPERLAASRDALPAAVQLRQGDVRKLPYDDASFDVVLLFTVLSSLGGPQDVGMALREAGRVMRPDATLLIYEPRYPNPLNRHTARIPVGLVREALGPVEERPVTVWPPVARRLGRFTEPVYRRLAGRRWATSHRLLAYRNRSPKLSLG